MQAYRLKKRVSKSGNIQLDALPFDEGEIVDVIVLQREEVQEARNGSSLKGSVKTYVDPTGPVALDDWETARLGEPNEPGLYRGLSPLEKKPRSVKRLLEDARGDR